MITDIPKIKVRVSLNTDSAIMYLSQAFEVVQETKEIQEQLLRAENRTRSAQARDLAVVAQETENDWNDLLRASIREYGEDATINAIFVLGSPV